MSAVVETHRTGVNLSPQQCGMLTFLLSEVAFFSTLIAVYVSYMGRDVEGPTPAVLSLGLVSVTTACLVASSATIHQAERSLRARAHSGFLGWWAATIVLGVVFLAGTAYEWKELIHRDGLTISRNLFGTTYYTLVGFHALHVTVGVLVMLTVLGLAWRRHVKDVGVELVAWYWHFVDLVWLVVFTLVYLVR